MPVLALIVNALVWGTSWWPFRAMRDQGLHPLWATALIYIAVSAAIVLLRPRALATLMRTPVLWVLVLAAGTTNAAFNWGVVIGDVVRVVLLFYLMPLWSVLLARGLLDERLTRIAVLRIALAMAGAAVILWPGGGNLADSVVVHWLPDLLGLVGGFSFALNNVMLRREAHRPEAARALAMFIGGAVVATALAASLTAAGSIGPPPPAGIGWIAIALVMAALFAASNLALQYGAARLPAHITAVVMLTEVVFASASALALGAGTATAALALGGALVFAAALLAAFEP
ncbi:MAG: DMT family transporter [Proteobacteria bacterium]|nr:DMT family transporter [Pseudomonadota bacterium]